ncbi:MAG: hypothetical protein CL908_04750 [Deltaproteobacteria bacterium]|nr:hypothetical protein [Deltaproteobacteria bacterium]
MTLRAGRRTKNRLKKASERRGYRLKTPSGAADAEQEGRNNFNADGIDMNTRQNTPDSFSRDPILLLGTESRFEQTLAQELRGLPAEVICAESFEEASARAGSACRPPSVVLVAETQIQPDEFEGRLAELQIRTGANRLIPIAFGRAPDEKRRRALRQAGIELALFGRFGRHALRFQINRALSHQPGRRPRGEQRAPKEWRTRSFSSGREKAVRCYSLSSSGGYFVTPRPWIVGSEIALELPLAENRLLLAGRILYTNGPGASEQRVLPRGMAVAFDPLSLHVREAIRQDVTETQHGLEV